MRHLWNRVLSIVVNTVAGFVAIPGAHAIVDVGPEGERPRRRRR
ncbi:hypothetical protein [Agrococcus terreus]|nr:hypothetical protein [Agrococcus terreus]